MGDRSGAWAPHRTVERSVSGGTSPGASLPTPLNRFFGREEEIATAIDVLRRPDVRLVTMTGPGGVGKTRLAIEIAQAMESTCDGVSIIDLAPITDAALVPQTVAQHLGSLLVRDESPVDFLARVIADRNLLLVLDNFEQVIDAALFLDDLLRRTTRLTLLVTSREPLRLSAERVFPVRPLPLPSPTQAFESVAGMEVVRLFVDRAEAATGNFRISEANAAVIADICGRLDGLPLAIELAAARTPHLPPAALLNRLNDRLTLLTSGARDTPARQRSMRDTIAWSYELLSSDERRVFRRLSVFLGGFTLDAVHRVAVALDDLEPDVLDIVGSLAAKNLVRVTELPDGTPRYTMLETIREFGLDQLKASGEEHETRGRHAAYTLALVERITAQSGGEGSTRRFLDSFEAELANWRQALAYFAESGDATRELQLASYVGSYWCSRGGLRESMAVLEGALARGESAQPSARASAMGVLACIYGESGHAERALELSAPCVALAREIGDPSLLVSTLVDRGLALRGSSRTDEAIEVLAEAAALGRTLDPVPGSLAVALANLGAALMDGGDVEQGAAHVEEALAVSRALGLDHLAALSLARLGRAAQLGRQPALAAARYGDSLRINFAAGVVMYVDRVLVGLAGIGVDHGYTVEAAELLGAVEAIQAQTGSTSLMWPEERDRTAAKARIALGNDRFEQARRAGRLLPSASVEARALRLADELAAAPVSRGRPSNREVPCGITERELDVLRLLAAGQSDRQIADALYISHRTVNAHVAHIFDKLGVNTRAEAAVAAERLGLLQALPE